MLPPMDAMRGYPLVDVEPGVADQVRHGQVLAAAPLGIEGAGPWAVIDADGALLAVYERYENDQVKPAVVIG